MAAKKTTEAGTAETIDTGDKVKHQGLEAALIAAQAEIANVTKDAKNPHFKSTYATLAAVLDVAKPVLARHGLAVLILPGGPKDSQSDKFVMTSTLLHESGEERTTVVTVPLQKADPQGVGSAITYMRRYCLAAILNIAQEDDDGNSASVTPKRDSRASGELLRVMAAIGAAGSIDDLEKLRPEIKKLADAEDHNAAVEAFKERKAALA